MWQVGFAIALFLTTAVVMNFVLPAEQAVTRKSAGHDFLAFYTAGTFVRTGRSAELYDLEAVRAFEQEIVRREGLELRPEGFGPYWNPPLFAWVFAPLSALSYHAAWTIWTSVNLACFVAAMAILCRMIRSSGDGQTDWRTWGLLPLLTITSMPFVQSVGHAQNTCVSLLIVAATVSLWRGNRALLAGMVAGLLFYKPQLSAVLATALVITCGWRALAGLAITGSAVVIATVLSLPGTLEAFLRRLPQNVHFMQVENVYLWDRHVTLKAFWRLLIQGFTVGEATILTQSLYLASLALLAAGLLATLWMLRRDPTARDRLIAATIAAMPLLMPFYFDYDLLLLAVPATLLAANRAAGEPFNRPLFAAWAALYAWLIVNPAVTAATHVNGTVILLSLVAAIMIRRAAGNLLPLPLGAGRSDGLLLSAR